ncbi:3-hydroxyisobutyrate dehydrogenase [Marinobacter sp. es.048]|uniref:3-hydroxyisobutyrate dehydrogenase n=1 Tax=Marinobacter sp. es.048 TaxID=1761795 RepID=UPI000B58AC7A|nr:3-hydroxyisobutyrate dehydrogenase [Marinobacter sp. es.048]SNC62568.1 3-hydroxyisobutyrate dehydrogenase [Marinobacter sp. es.048]
MTTIAFIGLGNMGGPMAYNLVKAGYQVNAFDLSDSAVKTVTDAGARKSDSATSAIEGANIVISMLPAGRHVESLYLGDEGLFQKIAPGTLVIDSSTIAPETSRNLAEAGRVYDIRFLDAPVSGGVAGATAGTLTFICGGAVRDYNEARPILETMGKNIFHAGENGAGQVAKICNNMLLSILMCGTSETLALGEKNGLDPKVLSEVIKQSSGGNWALNRYNPWPGVMENAPASKGYQGGFLVDLMSKDLGLALDNAVTNKAAIPLGSLARNLFQLHGQQGNGRLDFSSIQNFYRDSEEG